MNCTELIPNKLQNRNLSESINYKNYDRLHPQGRSLIQGWFTRAWNLRDSEDEECFEPFIFLWIAFNAWAACVTGLDHDYKWKTALMQHNEICNKFGELLKNDNFKVLASDFSKLWPIFKAQEIRRHKIYSREKFDRKKIIEFYFERDVRYFEPKCWKRHFDAGEKTLDWPHTLAALYQVRCNLFHGEKAPHSEMDKLIVSRGFRVLLNFLKEKVFVT